MKPKRIQSIQFDSKKNVGAKCLHPTKTPKAKRKTKKQQISADEFLKDLDELIEESKSQKSDVIKNIKAKRKTKKPIGASRDLPKKKPVKVTIAKKTVKVQEISND